jgi:hypothetical protein
VTDRDAPGQAVIGRHAWILEPTRFWIESRAGYYVVTHNVEIRHVQPLLCPNLGGVQKDPARIG